ncbi:MAG: G5 domain-containing protein [Oscillospiraceae bacterium]|nr:G5 domain-containing protein [Oscillospiraceae bacterium]
MGRNEKAALSLRKTLAISLIFIVILGIKAVIASNTELNSVTIQFSNNHEITVLTSRTKVSEILADNNIILASNETVLPGLDEEITETRTIKIFEIGSVEFEIIEVAESPDENSVEDILQRYEDIKHRIEVVIKEIPFETITRDVSEGSGDTDNRVIQQGRNGEVETKYKVTFQNDIEIARVEIETRVIREPQYRIVQTQNRPTTRAGVRGGDVGLFQAYAHEHVIARGWSDYDFQALINLWNRESNWNPNARNPSSAARGIPQAMMGTHFRGQGTGSGGSWEPNPGTAAYTYITCWQTQIRWGINYIAGRHSTPTAAWNHFLRVGWY